MRLGDAAALVLRGLRFTSPPRAELVIYDRGGSDRLLSTALKGLEHAVLPTRRELFYLSPAILWRMLRNLRLVDEWRFGRLFLVYLYSCLEHMRPRVVITFVDNDPFFHKLARLYPGATFLAVQNGVKTPEGMASRSQHPLGWLPEPPAWGSRVDLPELFCWGEHEIEIHRRYGHTVDRFHAVGSLVGGYYKGAVFPGPAPVEHDVLLVSQWRASMMEEGAYPYLLKGKETLHGFLARYVAERETRFAVALCSKDPRERAYFERIFGDKARFVDFDREGLSTYHAMDRAEISVSLSSAAAYEAVGWGKKVFFCNFTGTDARDCPRKGFWSLETPDYAEFRTRLDALRAMPAGEFERRAGADMRYLMAFDPARPAHVAVRQRVLEALGRRPAPTEKLIK